MDNREYHECVQLTQQFKFCPNAFRVDMYRGCSFGCKYCFAEMEAFNESELSNFREAKINTIEKLFDTAYSGKESKSVLVEMIQHRVPMHCGGMSDPFQAREWKLGLTKQLIELSNKYNYPMQFSTKTAHLPQEYFDILNPQIHAFQVSIMGWNDDYISKWETNTPTAQDRLSFVKQLRVQGFWCSVRIQPVIDVNECLQLIHEAKDVPSYYSIEHLHTIYNSDLDTSLIENGEDFDRASHKMNMKYQVKIRNIQRLIQAANQYGVLVGAGDNDLHFMSQSRCCCGLDTINDNFSQYLKYNLTYMSTGECDLQTIWAPENNLRRHMNEGRLKEIYFKPWADEYVIKNLNLIPDKYRKSIEKQLFGSYQKRLF